MKAGITMLTILFWLPCAKGFAASEPHAVTARPRPAAVPVARHRSFRAVAVLRCTAQTGNDVDIVLNDNPGEIFAGPAGLLNDQSLRAAATVGSIRRDPDETARDGFDMYELTSRYVSPTDRTAQLIIRLELPTGIRNDKTFAGLSPGARLLGRMWINGASGGQPQGLRSCLVIAGGGDFSLVY